MAITLRGTCVFNSNGATSGALNLASLTGGSDSSVQDGDWVFAFPAHDTGGSALSPLDPGAADWTPLEELPDNAAASVRAGAWFRIWRTGDTTVPAFQTAGASNTMLIRCLVFNPGGATITGAVRHNSVGLNTSAATLTATALVATAHTLEILAVIADDLVTMAAEPVGGAAPSDMTAGGYHATSAMAQAVYYHLSPTAVSRAPGVTFSGNTERIAIHIMVDVLGGPSIDTQPTAQTVVLHNDPRVSAVFTSAATTSGGTLNRQWQEEDSVGAGTYSDIEDGGIYAGATTDELTVTPSDTSKDGLRYRNNYSDDNGSQATSAVALSVYEGPQLDDYTLSTDDDGLAVPAFTSDLALSANGALLRIRAVHADGAVIRHRRPA